MISLKESWLWKKFKAQNFVGYYLCRNRDRHLLEVVWLHVLVRDFRNSPQTSHQIQVISN